MSEDSVTWDKNNPESIQLAVHAVAPGWLVLSDVYYPAWQVRVDGSPGELEIADEALRAVAVPAGNHSIQFVYASPALPIGAAISGMTVFAVSFFALRTRRAR